MAASLPLLSATAYYPTIYSFNPGLLLKSHKQEGKAIPAYLCHIPGCYQTPQHPGSWSLWNELRRDHLDGGCSEFSWQRVRCALPCKTPFTSQYQKCHLTGSPASPPNLLPDCLQNVALCCQWKVSKYGEMHFVFSVVLRFLFLLLMNRNFVYW